MLCNMNDYFGKYLITFKAHQNIQIEEICVVSVKKQNLKCERSDYEISFFSESGISLT